jgi:hypothetical protein
MPSFELRKYEKKLVPLFKSQLRWQKVTDYFQLFLENTGKMLPGHLTHNIFEL